RSGGRNYAVTDQSVALVSGLMCDSRVHSLKDFGGYCHPIEAPAVGQTLNHAQALLEPSTSRAFQRGRCRPYTDRAGNSWCGSSFAFTGSTTVTVWLPLQTADGSDGGRSPENPYGPGTRLPHGGCGLPL
ncbi:hypothetical protein, partial [Gluconobacter sp. P5H9_a]|uniref:hypothetical protein n=1 Tax=Gluconobacter sp. P5H9_a TaxID=2762616 RepID=UPI001C05910E